LNGNYSETKPLLDDIMSMTIRERILAVYKGETPDVIPYMLDLSHYFYHKYNRGWDLSRSYSEPEYELIEYHKRFSVGFYIPNLGSFFSISYPDNVKSEVSKEIVDGQPEITWLYETPLGVIKRTRRWDPETYSWAIKNWSVKTEDDLKILSCAMANRSFSSDWKNYQAWSNAVGDDGVVYLPLGYSAIGYLLNYWMGIEGVMYAVMDWADLMHEIVDQINGNLLDMVDFFAQSPAEIIFMGDNISSDIQPPHFFNEWSRPFYEEAIKRFHESGKYVAVHIDGRLQNALEMVRNTGADAADAVTPAPMGDITAAQCFEEAGPNFILSGGVSPDLWLPNADIEQFKKAVMDWLDLKNSGARIIANAGDQVPPGAEENRIEIMRDLIEEYGKY